MSIFRCTPIICVLISLALPVCAATFVVNDDADDGQANDVNPGNGVCLDGAGGCTLRAAIEEANANPGSDVIDFGFDGVVVVDAGQGPLPAITDVVVITGVNAPGFPGRSVNLEDAIPSAYIDGSQLSGSADGLRFTAGAAGSEVEAIGIVNFPGNGIEFADGADRIRVTSTYLGIDPNGAVAGNGNGILIASDNNIIGASFLFGLPFLFGNVISGNEDAGIALAFSVNNRIAGNRIGTAPNGLGARPNGIGINGLLTNDNQIGIYDDDDVIGNVIGGNDSHGINIIGGGNEIVGNFIGVSIVGNDSSPNGGDGINLIGIGNVIGGLRADLRNIIANNEIGVDVDAAGGAVGIGFNQIGIPTLSQNNTGQGNRATGVRISNADGGLIENNRINFNGGDGIELADDVTSLLVADNIIGVDFVTMGDNGNAGDGISSAGSGVAISRNLIGNNGGFGVWVSGNDNQIVANQVGRQTPEIEPSVPNVAGPIGNAIDGIALRGEASDNVISLNVIGDNGDDGISVDRAMAMADPINNRLHFNRIANNNGIGINLGSDGRTANDSDDADTGANKLQNFPTIINVALVDVGGSLKIEVTWQIESSANHSAFPVVAEFYAADNRFGGEGAMELGTATASVGFTPVVTLLDLPIVGDSGYLVATATDADGNTSEFTSVVMYADILFANGFE